MHNLKFCNKLLSLLLLTYKQNNLWFDIILTKNIFSMLQIFRDIGVIMNFFIFIKNKKKTCRVFLKYINLETPLIMPIFFYFKPSHKLCITSNKLKKLSKKIGDISLVISTSRGLLLHKECIDLNIGGILYLIVYS
jgi:ribosomal protein S8